MFTKIKKAFWFYRTLNHKKARKTIKAIRKQYGLHGLWRAIKNKLSNRPLLAGLAAQMAEVPNFDEIGRSIYRRQQTELTREKACEAIKGMGIQPLISIIMPIYNAPVPWLQKAVESLQDQFYGNWELCVVDDGSSDGRGTALIEELQKSDSRIRFCKIKKNGGISSASNRSLEMAEGEYVALLDQDDEVTPDAFFWFVKEINEHPPADFLYSDECKIGVENEPVLRDFYFKPDWSPEMMMNHMYTGHLTMYRTQLVRDVGGFRSRFDFSQDYDLALRASEHATDIRHIERILYFWRMLPTSGAAGGKDYARLSNLDALADCFRRRGIPAIAEKWEAANYISAQREANPLISIIIPTDSTETLLSCIENILRNASYKNYELIPVTNSRTAKDIQKEFPYLDCLRTCCYDKLYNFSDKCNEGAKVASGSILVFYNDDVKPFARDCFDRMLDILAFDGVGGVSPLMIHEDHTIQYAGMTIGTPGIAGTVFNGCLFYTVVQNAFHQLLIRDVSILSGACLMIKKNIFEEIGGFDAVNTPSGHSDLDLSLKLLEKGYRCVYTPYASFVHIGNHSWHAKKRADKSDIYCLRHWGKYLERDRYFTDSMKELLYRDFPYRHKIYSPDSLILPNRNDGKDILFLSHELTRTGAPVVLKDMAGVALEKGHFPVIISPVDGPLREEYLAMGVTVIIDESFVIGHWMFEHFARNFDLVVACTLGCAKAVELLDISLPPVLWWLHEGTYALNHFRSSLNLSKYKHAKIFSGSKYVERILKKEGFDFEAEPLLYCVKDASENDCYPNGNKMVFTLVGSIEERKGQDLLLDAISILTEEERNKMRFVIIGSVLKNKLFEKIKTAISKYKNIEYYASMTRDELFDYYRNSNCLLITSRDDPLPVTATEGMMLSRALICSENTGTADYISEGKSGLLFKSGDAHDLADRLRYAVGHPGEIREMGQQARKIYEKYFTAEQFRENVGHLFNKYLQ